MSQQHNFLIGTVVGFQGLRGLVKVRPSTNNPDLLLDIETVRVDYATGMRPHGISADTLLEVDDVRFEKRMLIMSFAEYPDRTAVEHLEGAQLYTADDQLKSLKEEEFWIKDLVGVDVYKTNGERIGKVHSIIYGGNDLLEIKRDNDPSDKTILVPFVKDLVPLVDLAKKRIEVLDLPGLLEPQ